MEERETRTVGPDRGAAHGTRIARAGQVTNRGLCYGSPTIVQTVTTIADIVEEQLATELAPSSIPGFAALSDDDLRRLAVAVREHSQAEYTRPPSVEEGEICCLLHQNSELTQSLGGAARRFGVTIDQSPAEMMGSLFLGLMYFPRIAVADGLGYFLDYWTHRLTPLQQRHRQTVLNLLEFYCHVRPLIAGQHLVVIPSSIWTGTHIARANLHAERGSAQPTIAQEVAQQIKEGPYWETLRASGPYWDQVRDATTRDDVWKFSVAHTLSFEVNEVEELLLISTLTGYTPVLERPVQHAIMEAFTQLGGVAAPSTRSARWIQQQSALVPVLSHLSPADFLAVRSSSGFTVFRETVEGIGREIPKWNDSPREMKEMIRTKLNDAKTRLDREVAESSVLRRAFVAFRELTLGAVVTNAALGAIDPSWFSDPWKVAITALGGGGGKLLNEFLKQRGELHGKASAARAIAGMMAE